MKSLKEITTDSRSLSDGLKHNAERHQNYKLYTSMDRALAFLLDGQLFITDGTNWNDLDDSNKLRERSLYAKCFSCSTRENIAMWMLYGDCRGKNGAVLNFLPSVMKEIVETETVLLGKFVYQGKFESMYELKKGVDYDIYLTDLLYVDPCKNNRIKLNYYDTSIVTDEITLENDEIFCKNVAWGYEKESRLIIRLKEKWRILSRKEQLCVVRITLGKKALTKMRKRGIIKSPIYSGGVDFGELSKLSGTVKWDL